MSRKQKSRKMGLKRSSVLELERARRFFATGRLRDALATAKRIVADQPNNAEAYILLGAIANSDKQYYLAEQFLRTALNIDPVSVEAHNQLGQLLRGTGYLAGAEQAFRKAIALRPDDPVAYNGLGAVLANRAQHHEAVAVFQQALPLDQAPFYMYSNLLWCLQYDAASTAAKRLAIAREYGERLDSSYRHRAFPRPDKRYDSRQPIRLGYVSPDLGMHPVGIFFASMLSSHDSNAFHVYCYSGSLKEDEITSKLKTWSHAWRPTSGLSDDQLAQLIRADEIDILVDLNGHAGLHRLGVFALKPAPVQVSWLGYPETTGLPAIDYVISDPVTVTPAYERYFIEQVVHLPKGRFCYKPPEYAPLVSDPPFMTKGYVTFGSFNNLTKLGEDVVKLWCQVLRAVPRSRLLLKWRSLSCKPERERIVRQFVNGGLTPDRLELRAAVPYPELLKEYADVDIALDTSPFSGGLTSCDALWQGVPVITLPQDRPASRQTLGFLKTIGYPEFAANNGDEYVAIASEMADNAERLAHLRSEIRPRMAASALCDTRQFARELEAIYREMLRKWQASEGR